MTDPCRFNDASGYLPPDDWDGILETALVPQTILIRLRALIPQLVPLLGYDPGWETQIRLAEELSKQPRNQPRLARADRCVTDVVGRCTGKGMVICDELDDNLFDLLEEMEDDMREAMIPFIGSGGFVARVLAIRNSYINIVWDIANCVQSVIASQVQRKKISEVIPMAYHLRNVCVEKEEVSNK